MCGIIGLCPLLTEGNNDVTDCDYCPYRDYKHEQPVFDVEPTELYPNKDSYAPFLEQI